MASKRTMFDNLLVHIESRCVGQGDCLIWTGATTGDKEYGVIRINGKIYQVHRIAYEERHGDLGVYDTHNQVCHTCDNGLCLEDSHHFVGNTSDNRIDCVLKDRNNSPKGSKCSWAKLTEEDVKNIRTLRTSGHSCRSIARKYKVSHQTISNATNGTDWRHVT